MATEEDIASSFGDLQNDDLFFFFGLFWLTVQDILASPPPQPSSQALSLTGLPGKRVMEYAAEWMWTDALLKNTSVYKQIWTRHTIGAGVGVGVGVEAGTAGVDRVLLLLVLVPRLPLLEAASGVEAPLLCPLLLLFPSELFSLGTVG